MASLILLIDVVSAAQFPGHAEPVPSQAVSTAASSFNATHAQISTVAAQTPVAVPTETADPAPATSPTNQSILGVTMDSQSPSFAILVEAISVLLFGGILALILEWQSRRYQRSQQRSTSDEAKFRYLLGIKHEIELILDPFDGWMGLIGKTKEFQEMQDRGEDIPFNQSALLDLLNWQKNTYWDALVPSGLLPSLISPDLLSRIADFYQRLYVLVRHINDVVRWGEQRGLEMASYGSSAKYMAMAEQIFGDPRRENKTKQMGEDFTKFLSLGEKVLEGLEEALQGLSPHHSPSTKITDYSEPRAVSKPEQSEPEQSGPFKDITLLNLNEHLTKPKVERLYTSRIVRSKENDPVSFTFVFRLSDRPPEGWGERLYYGPLDRTTNWMADEYSTDQRLARVQGRYLIVESQKDELIEHLPFLRLAIAQQNEAYRERLAKETADQEREARQAAALKQEISDLKEWINSELAKDIDLELIRSQLKDSGVTGDSPRI